MSVVSAKSRLSELKSWYAIYTMPRSEKKVEARLSLRGKVTYLPLISSIRTWSDRKKKITLPLIPGFIFVFCTEAEVFDCLHVQGALGVLRYLGKPARVRETEIQLIRILLQEPESIAGVKSNELVVGEDVRVICGPFIGLMGKCLRFQGQCKVVIEIRSLRSLVEVNIPLAYLERVGLKVA